MSEGAPSIEQVHTRGKVSAARGRVPVRVSLALLLALIGCLSGVGGLGCWAAQTRVVEPPALAQVPDRADLDHFAAPASDSRRPDVSLISESHELEAWEPIAPDRDWQYVVLHHSGTSRGSVESIDAEHRQRTDRQGNSWLGIGYHFVIGNGDPLADGEVVPTFRWRQQLAGAHAGDTEYNGAGIGVCVIGDCQSSPPTARQVQALKQLVGMLAARYQIQATEVVGHSQVKSTDCPGKYFPLREVAAAADNSRPSPSTAWRSTRGK